jgi:putative transposase
MVVKSASSVSGSFFHILKTEPVHHQTCQKTCQTRAEARQAIFEYIGGFYSRERLHPANDYMSPVGYELLHKAA